MALVQCPECRKNVSTNASACPHCGNSGPFQPPPKSVGSGKVILLVIAAFAGISLLLNVSTAVSDSQTKAAEAEAARLKNEALTKRTSDANAAFAANADAVKAQLADAIAKDDYQAVASILGTYAGANRADFVEMKANAEKMRRTFFLLKDVREGTNRTTAQNLHAYQELVGLHPDRKDFAFELARYEKKDAAEKAAAIKEAKAKKKREGVRIGMTEQDVLDSSWGKPKRINRDTGSWGEHAQWVYDGGNYLYFENGVLTSISN